MLWTEVDSVMPDLPLFRITPLVPRQVHILRMFWVDRVAKGRIDGDEACAFMWHLRLIFERLRLSNVSLRPSRLFGARYICLPSRRRCRKASDGVTAEGARGVAKAHSLRAIAGEAGEGRCHCAWRDGSG